MKDFGTKGILCSKIEATKHLLFLLLLLLLLLLLVELQMVESWTFLKGTGPSCKEQEDMTSQV